MSETLTRGGPRRSMLSSDRRATARSGGFDGAARGDPKPHESAGIRRSGTAERRAGGAAVRWALGSPADEGRHFTTSLSIVVVSAWPLRFLRGMKSWAAGHVDLVTVRGGAVRPAGPGKPRDGKVLAAVTDLLRPIDRSRSAACGYGAVHRQGIHGRRILGACDRHTSSTRRAGGHFGPRCGAQPSSWWDSDRSVATARGTPSLPRIPVGSAPCSPVPASPSPPAYPASWT